MLRETRKSNVFIIIFTTLTAIRIQPTMHFTLQNAVSNRSHLFIPYGSKERTLIECGHEINKILF